MYQQNSNLDILYHIPFFATYCPAFVLILLNTIVWIDWDTDCS